MAKMYLQHPLLPFETENYCNNMRAGKSCMLFKPYNVNIFILELGYSFFSFEFIRKKLFQDGPYRNNCNHNMPAIIGAMWQLSAHDPGKDI